MSLYPMVFFYFITIKINFKGIIGIVTIINKAHPTLSDLIHFIIYPKPLTFLPPT